MENPISTSRCSALQPLGAGWKTPRRATSSGRVSTTRYGAAKYLRVKEASALEFRIEAFNVFNHAQFFGPRWSMAM